jgi:hypothetical protein
MKHLAPFILWAICIFLTTLSPAQTTTEQGRSPLLKYDFVSLLGDGVTTSMGIKLGIELPVKDKQSIEFDVMYIFPCASCDHYLTINTEKTNGFMLTAEYRFYLYPGKPPSTGFHLGPQMMYQYTIATLAETYDNGIPNDYQVFRNLWAIHAMVGYQLKVAGPLYFDPAIGLGTRFISSRNENKKGTEPGQYEFPYEKLYDTGAKWFPSYTFNIKIVFKL